MDIADPIVWHSAPQRTAADDVLQGVAGKPMPRCQMRRSACPEDIDE